MIHSLAGLQKWTAAGQRVVPGSRYAGSAKVRALHSEGSAKAKGKTTRKLKHPNDVLGLFTDKLAMAISVKSATFSVIPQSNRHSRV